MFPLIFLALSSASAFAESQANNALDANDVSFLQHSLEVQSQSSAPAPAPAPARYERLNAATNRQCEASSKIETWAECKQAANDLGIKWESGEYYSAGTWAWTPPGCWYWPAQAKQGLVGTELGFNTGTGSNNGNQDSLCKSKNWKPLGTIKIIDESDYGPGNFGIKLDPKPSVVTKVTCIASKQDGSNACCNGGNEFNFNPETETKGASTTTGDFGTGGMVCSAPGYKDVKVKLGNGGRTVTEGL